MENCKAIEMPHDPKTKLKKNVNKDDEMVKVPYQQLANDHTTYDWIVNSGATQHMTFEQ
jgi:hypothetical protein